MPFAQTGGQLLLHLISRLYELTSIIVITNLAFGEWRRVRRRCGILEIGNESFAGHKRSSAT